jgi:hypothetical protein
MLMQTTLLRRSRSAAVRFAPRAAAHAAIPCLWLLSALVPALAFSDREFCIVAQQLVAATKADVGVWIDRQTRNAGMFVSCDRRSVEFTRFTYAPSASMNQSWLERKSADWNAVHCASPVWNEAIRNGWKVMLSQASADGGRVTISAQCAK